MGLLSDLFGKKPKVPKLQTLEEAQGKAVGANIASFKDIAQLAVAVDDFNQERLLKLSEMTLPGGRQKIQDIITSRLAGEIPDDVGRQIQRFGAERAVAGGFSGSQFGVNQTARNLGLTSLDIIDSGLSSAEAWLATANAPGFDVTSMFITPQQKYADQVNQFNRDFTEAKIKASPDPGTRGIFDTSMQILGMALSAYGGGPGYTGTYNPQQTWGSPGGGTGADWQPPASTQGPGGFYMGTGQSNSWGFGRTGSDMGGKWFIGKYPGKG